jgi:hypothetical protein
MNALAIGAIVLLGLGAYFAAGVLTCRRRLPIIWKHARREWSGIDSYVRSSVRWRIIGTVLAGPVLLLAVDFGGRLDRFAEGGDPKILAAKLREREQRIAELERWNRDWERAHPEG